MYSVLQVFPLIARLSILILLFNSLQVTCTFPATETRLKLYFHTEIFFSVRVRFYFISLHLSFFFIAHSNSLRLTSCETPSPKCPSSCPCSFRCQSLHSIWPVKLAFDSMIISFHHFLRLYYRGQICTPPLLLLSPTPFSPSPAPHICLCSFFA